MVVAYLENSLLIGTRARPKDERELNGSATNHLMKQLLSMGAEGSNVVLVPIIKWCQVLD